MQFSIRARAYAMQFPAADNYVILLGGEPAGQMIVDRSGSGILLVDIAVLPEFRGRGIATHLIGELQAEARSFGRGVTLQVDRGNTPARSLYERLGFTVVDDDDEIDLVMEWRAAT